MRFLTRLILLAFALVVCTLPDYGQEAKAKQDAPAPAPANSPTPTVAGPPAPAVEYSPSNWKEYYSQAGRFTISFPGTRVEEVDNSSSGLPGRKYTLKTTAVYVVIYLDLPDSFPHDLETEVSLRNQMFDKARDSAVTTAGGKIISETEISLDSHPGRLLKFSTPDGTVMRQKSYVVGKRIYQVLVATPRELLAPDGGEFNRSRTTKFLDSFKFGRPVAIEENPEAWKVYSSTPGRFAVLFPGTPTMTDHSYDTDFGRCDAQAYTLKGSAEYVVSYTDFVIELELDSKAFNTTLDSIRDHSAEDIKGKVLDDTAISIAGHKGRMIRLGTPDEKITTVKAFAVAKRLYLLIVTTPAVSQTSNATPANDAWVTKFFDSFKVTSQ